ncbi:MAG: PqqD family protein [Clostridia bacterium]|nr:PqqD family protein [Clostridia bacterium]
MQIRDGFLLREVAGNFVVVAIGDDVLDFNAVITVNELGATIWHGIEDRKDKAQIVEEILTEYDIDKETVSNDFDEFISQLKSNNIITD